MYVSVACILLTLATFSVDESNVMRLRVSVVCPTSNIWGLIRGRKGIDMSKWNKPGTNLRAIPLHISYIYPYLPVMHSVRQVDMGICGIHTEFSQDTMRENVEGDNPNLVLTPQERF